MKNSKKQYVVLHRFSDTENWTYSKLETPNKSLRDIYARDMDEVRSIIATVRRNHPGKERIETSVCGSIGMDYKIDAEMANREKGLRFLVRVREVTAWEEVEI